MNTTRIVLAALVIFAAGVLTGAVGAGLAGHIGTLFCLRGQGRLFRLFAKENCLVSGFPLHVGYASARCLG